MAHPTTMGFLRNTYSGLFLKLLVCAFAVIIYVMTDREHVNKPAIISCVALYFIYTLLEMRSLRQWNKERRMPKQEFPLNYLQNYLPASAAPLALGLLQQYKVHLTITKERKTVLGDYRHAHNNAAHRISVNGNLNQYAFLITLVHELAHLVTFLEYGNRVQAHGREWKHVYKLLLVQFLELNIFPQDILTALRSSLHNLPASSCADEGLMRILRKYDEKQDGMVLVEELPDGALFAMDDGKIFQKGKRLRKRFQCTELKTGKLYLFSPIYEVKKVS